MEKLVSENKNNNQKFFPVFQEVIKQLWDPRDNSAYSPYNFKKRLGDMNPLFKGAYPNDAKDLLTFILLQLHEELNKPKNNNNNNDMNIINNINMQIDKKIYFMVYFILKLNALMGIFLIIIKHLILLYSHLKKF